MRQHFSTFSHNQDSLLYLLGHGPSNMALLAIAETKTLSLALKAILFIGSVSKRCISIHQYVQLAM